MPRKKHYVQKSQTWNTQAPSGADREPRGSWRERVEAAEGKAEGWLRPQSVSSQQVQGIPHFILRTVMGFEKGVFCSNVGSREDEWIQELS